VACRNDTLQEMLDDYKEYAGLSVHWVIVGPSNRLTRPESGGVLKHYTECSGKGRHIVKTIANTYFLENISTHPHNFQFRCADTEPCACWPIPAESGSVSHVPSGCEALQPHAFHTGCSHMHNCSVEGLCKGMSSRCSPAFVGRVHAYMWEWCKLVWRRTGMV
jgi:hypothetical protein